MPIKFKLFTGELDFSYIDSLAKIYLFSTLTLYVITIFGVIGCDIYRMQP
jgi:hypothetical protein